MRQNDVYSDLQKMAYTLATAELAIVLVYSGPWGQFASFMYRAWIARGIARDVTVLQSVHWQLSAICGDVAVYGAECV